MMKGVNQANLRVPARDIESGAAAVEFALVVPMLLLLVFGLIQYGLYFGALQGGSAAAREAARSASVGNPTSCDAFRSEIEATLTSMQSGNVKISRTYSSTGPVKVGDDVTVSVAFDSIDLGLPLVPFISGGRVEQSAITRVENVPDSTIANCS